MIQLNAMKAYVMVGAPGSGKSTWAAGLKKDLPGSVIINGDTIRKELYGDANIQGNYAEIHDRMIEILEDNVGRTIILDNTHYRSSYRKDAIEMLRSYGYDDIVAVVVNTPLPVALQRNSERSRVVPEYVIEKMHNSLQASLEHIYDEGFSKVRFIH